MELSWSVTPLIGCSKTNEPLWNFVSGPEGVRGACQAPELAAAGTFCSKRFKCLEDDLGRTVNAEARDIEDPIVVVPTSSADREIAQKSGPLRGHKGKGLMLTVRAQGPASIPFVMQLG